MSNFGNRRITITDAHFSNACGLLKLSNQSRKVLSIFSFSEQTNIRGFFALSIKEMTIWNIYRYFELSIQPLRQGHPPQIVASWFLEFSKFKGAIVEDLFERKHASNIVDIIEKSIYHGLNLSDFARELVPAEFDITMYSGVSLPQRGEGECEDEDERRREFNPLFSEIQFSIWTNQSHIKRNCGVLLSIENCERMREEVVEVFDESNHPINKKRRN